ncbi:hypothetical protein BDY19DRAFT_1047383 [Irpex rosettiformis]|uniref:Uncharacterized protein n=1 Tax=Irpex rosettiformis TaxID=378272 RepID=A0ACB8U7F0_9APHY|nr:hypothetical protein BDY19DRAFT_1047383 [Irpex rosettiformis]
MHQCNTASGSDLVPCQPGGNILQNAVVIAAVDKRTYKRLVVWWLPIVLSDKQGIECSRKSNKFRSRSVYSASRSSSGSALGVPGNCQRLSIPQWCKVERCAFELVDELVEHHLCVPAHTWKIRPIAGLLVDVAYRALFITRFCGGNSYSEFWRDRLPTVQRGWFGPSLGVFAISRWFVRAIGSFEDGIELMYIIADGSLAKLDTFYLLILEVPPLRIFANWWVQARCFYMDAPLSIFALLADISGVTSHNASYGQQPTIQALQYDTCSVKRCIRQEFSIPKQLQYVHRLTVEAHLKLHKAASYYELPNFNSTVKRIPGNIPNAKYGLVLRKYYLVWKHCVDPETGKSLYSSALQSTDARCGLGRRYLDEEERLDKYKCIWGLQCGTDPPR